MNTWSLTQVQGLRQGHTMTALLTGNATLQTVTGKTSLPVAQQVSVNGTPAALANGTNFTANVPLPCGTNTFSVVAQDASGHTETQRFSAQITGATLIQPTYDQNGNTLVVCFPPD